MEIKIKILLWNSEILDYQEVCINDFAISSGCANGWVLDHKNNTKYTITGTHHYFQSAKVVPSHITFFCKKEVLK